MRCLAFRLFLDIQCSTFNFILRLLYTLSVNKHRLNDFFSSLVAVAAAVVFVVVECLFLLARSLLRSKEPLFILILFEWIQTLGVYHPREHITYTNSWQICVKPDTILTTEEREQTHVSDRDRPG